MWGSDPGSHSSQITRACALRRSRVLVHPQTFGRKKENQHSECHIYVYVKCDFVVVVHNREKVCFPEDVRRDRCHSHQCETWMSCSHTLSSTALLRNV